MTMTTITGEITDPAGAPLVGVAVSAALVSDQGGYLADDSGEILSRATTTTGNDGSWSLTLTPNSEIAPSGTGYRVTRRVNGRTQVNTISVPVSGSPVEFASIITDASVVQGLAAGGVLAGSYPDPSFADADLTTFAALTPTNDDVLQRKSGAWANRTMAQVAADLAPVGLAYFLPRGAEPSSPAGGQEWLSPTLEHVHTDPSPTSRTELFTGQEPSLWYQGGSWRMIYSNGGLVYRSCSGDPTVAANWSSGTTLAGFPSTAAHAIVYVEGTTWTAIFVDTNDQLYYTATASSSAPTTWTVSGTPLFGSPLGNASTKLAGNPGMVKIGSTYYIFLESMTLYNLGDGDGTSASWQTDLYKGASPTGPFTLVYGPITSLRVDGISSVSGADPHLEDGKVVLYYHADTWGRALPGDIYRATIPVASIESDAWTITNGGAPVLQRAHVREVDQAVDPSAATGPSGVSYLAYSANDNTTSAFRVMITTLLPTRMLYDAARGDWRVSETVDISPPRWNYVAPRIQHHVAYLDPDGAATTGTWAVSATPSGMFGGARVTNSATAAQNDSIEWDVVLGPGQWTIRPVYVKGPDHGIATIELAFASRFFNTTIGTIDAYAASQSVNSAGTKTFFVRGRSTARGRIRFKMATKNAASTGYVWSDCGWALYRIDY